MMASYSASKSTVDLAIDPLITCKLCLTECSLQDMYELQDCQCVYCEPCVRQYLSVMITEGNVLSITCPDAQCRKQGKLDAAEIKQLVDANIFKRYRKIRSLKEVDLDPNRTFCPEAGCETVCHVCSTSSEEYHTKPTAVECPTCGLKFCSVCKSKWHDRKSCDDAIMSVRREDVGIPFNSAEDSQIKRCPMCHVPIERNDGCAQMMCKRCKHVFCWYCLTSLDDDFLLRHYDKGPCKNKLGHSRASVIWHRTQKTGYDISCKLSPKETICMKCQILFSGKNKKNIINLSSAENAQRVVKVKVVGIFAGFGVLLLVASPFLLLAAPCILCCKCKVCKCCDEEDPETLPT